MTDLRGLKGLPLDYLDIEHTDVRNVAPLAGVPLRDFRCRDTPIRDFDPLRSAPIRSLMIDEEHVDSLFVRSLRELRVLNGVQR